MKFYLDGMDHIAAMINHRCAKTPGQGSAFTVLLESPDRPDLAALQTALATLRPLFPVLNGRICRQKLHLAQYWQSGSAAPPSVSIQAFTPHAVADFTNTPLPAGSQLAICLLDRQEAGTVLLFKFSHLLFDGRGAELFLEMLRSGTLPEPLPRPGVPSPRLNEWRHQFTAGKKLQSHFIAEAQRGPLAACPAPKNARNHFLTHTFSAAETQKIQEQSDRLAGPFMLTVYLLAGVCRGYDELLQTRGITGDLQIPMSVDRRGCDGIPATQLFLNNWSFLPLRFARNTTQNRETHIAYLRRELFAVAEARLPEAFRVASRLTRIAPYDYLARIFRKVGRVSTGNLMFSFLSESSLADTMLAGRRITNIQHLPPMPPMTAVGVFFNRYRERLNLTVSYREGLFAEADMQRFAGALPNEYL